MTHTTRTLERPRTAWDALELTKEAIRREPWSYFQDAFVASKDPTLAARYLPRVLDVPENVCGTALCIAGHVVNLVDGTERMREMVVDTRAVQLMGAKPWGEIRDFTPSGEEFEFRSDLDSLFSGGVIHWSLIPGTPEYVEAGVRHIEVFQANWADRLKRTEIKYED